MLLASEFETIVRLTLFWVQDQEARALREGLPLSERERSIAQQAGVERIERVRLRPVTSMPSPDDPTLQSAMRATGLWLSNSAGLTLGHAIFVLNPASSRGEAWREEELIGHELVHVAQVERLGLEEFLRLYLEQCLSVGYNHAPLELEARQFRFREP